MSSRHAERRGSSRDEAAAQRDFLAGLAAVKRAPRSLGDEARRASALELAWPLVADLISSASRRTARSTRSRKPNARRAAACSNAATLGAAPIRSAGRAPFRAETSVVY